MKKLLIVCSIMLLSACNSGGTSSSGTIIVGGLWLGSFTSTNGLTIRFDMTINQGDTSVPGNINTAFSGVYRALNLNSCQINGGTFTGTISGAQVTFTLTDNSGAIFTFSGNVTNVAGDLARAMSGLLNATGGICGAFTGTWSMTRT